jgi:heterodisulfide reductase subunit D
MQKFNYSEYFRRVQDMKKIQIDASAVSWIERYETPKESHELVLVLGCNILRTPHIARQVVRVFEHLKLDFVAVGGTQYCCGIVWDSAKDIQKGQAVSQRTISRLESHQPRTVVMWCPSCNVHFADAVLGRDKKTPNFEITNAVQLLADRAREGDGLPWVASVNKKVVVHAHAGLEGHAEGQHRARRDREGVLALLEHVPGLEILDVIVSDPEMDYDCGPAVMKLAPGVFQEHQRKTIGRALDLGAEQIVTISHACQREWCGENTGQLGFRNYISVVGEALGLPVDIDLLTQYKTASSVEEIVEMSRPIWASHGMTEGEAKELAAHYRSEGSLRGYAGTKEA